MERETENITITQEAEAGCAAWKSALRAKLRRAIKELPSSYCREADGKIRERILALPEYGRAEAVFCFVGTKREIDTLPLIEEALRQGKQVSVPLCTGEGIMEARRILSVSQLRPGRYGILEPEPDTPRTAPGELDLSLIPCLSCSSRGGRLGQGGGYYDRYLRLAGGRKAVLCRRLLMREEIPLEAHDVPAELVICEEAVWRRPPV